VIHKNVPLVQQLVQEILTRVDNGELVRDGGLLPSEAELTQRFGVSRATVRDALGKLELAGVIIRRQGIGTFVNPLMGEGPGSLQCWIDEASGFTDLIRATGHQASCQVLRSEIQKAGKHAADLQCDPSAAILSVERLYFSDDSPIIHSLGCLPFHLVLAEKRDLLDRGYPASLSTYQFIEQFCGHTVHHQMSVTSAVVADDQIARLLECVAGDPLLRVAEIGYSAELLPLFCGVNHYRADSVNFRQIRKPVLQIAF